MNQSSQEEEDVKAVEPDRLHRKKVDRQNLLGWVAQQARNLAWKLYGQGTRQGSDNRVAPPLKRNLKTGKQDIVWEDAEARKQELNPVKRAFATIS